MKLLAIETSCDETAISILDVKKISEKHTFKILADNINSQVKIHAEYGGVFPALAKREHQINLPILFEKTIKEAKIKIEGIDLIVVTSGPGLEPALWTGIVFAKEISDKYKIPVLGVNHMEGHIFSIFPKKGKTFKIDQEKNIFPMLSLLVSGGHTELILIKSWKKYKKIGQTRDDAVGEAFDKVARMLGLPYPGGPEIGKLAQEARTHKINPNFTLPRPMMYTKDYEFSFSGLKTAVLYHIRDLKEKNPDILNDIRIKQMIAREFEDACFEVLSYKTMKALKEYKINTLIIGGGVSAAPQLKKVIKENLKNNKLKIKTHFPGKGHTGDNSIMIGIAGYFQYKNKKYSKNSKPIKAEGNLSL